MFTFHDVKWYVVVRQDNYPYAVYEDRELAKQVAEYNGYKVICVAPIDEKSNLNPITGP